MLTTRQVVTVVDIGLAPDEEQHLASLHLGRAAEQRGEGGCDRGRETTALREDFGRDQDQTRMGLVGGTVAAVQRDEVLNVGGDQRPSCGRRVCEDKFVGESR